MKKRVVIFCICFLILMPFQGNKKIFLKDPKNLNQIELRDFGPLF